MNMKRWTIFGALIILSVICTVSVMRLGAASPGSGTVTPTSPPILWTGTGVAGTSVGETSCVEGVSCDTFTLAVSGSPEDWAGKRIQVSIAWVLVGSDYDLYIRKGANNSGPLIGSSRDSFASQGETFAIDPSVHGTGVFSVRVVYATATAQDQYNGKAVVTQETAPPPAPPRSPDWKIVYHGTCCEGNLAAFGNDTYVLLPELATGNDIRRSSDGGQTWVKKYPPVDASEPFGIEGDLLAYGNDVIYFGTEVANGVAAHSDNRGDAFTVTQFPVPFVANDQCWSYLGPFSDLAPTGRLQTEPYVVAGWYRIGSVLVFSFDGGLTFPIQTPLVGLNGSGPEHVVCKDNSTGPSTAGDTRVANDNFRNWKSGRHGTWGTDRKFYWTETQNDQLYVCETSDFGANWTGTIHPLSPGPGQGFTVTNSAFDNNGTLYVLHGNKLYVSFNQGENFAFVHTLPRYGNALRSDSGADQYFVVDSGTIHIGLLEDAPQGGGRVYYLRGTGVDSTQPIWDEELVDEVAGIRASDGTFSPVRLDFMQIVLNGNDIPTISYTTPNLPTPTPAPLLSPTPTPTPRELRQVTTASRNTPLPAVPGRLQNISTRGRVQTDDNVLIGGFIIGGSAPKKVIVRGIGPSLQANGAPFAGRLEDPVLELYQQGDSEPIATNDNWRDKEADVAATGLQPTSDSEAAIVRTLNPGAYTAIVRGQNRSSGVALAEVYEIAGTDEAKLLNLSTRGFVETGDNVMIGGFIAGPSGRGATPIVVRGIAPSLKNQLPGALNDPTLELRDGQGNLIEENDDWQQSSGASQIQAASLAPGDPAESAILLPAAAPGLYTAILRGKGETTGIGLVETYNIP